MKKLALVLSGGAAKGYAHLGVLKVLERHHIKPDLIVGTSMGALVGGLYAAGKTIPELEKLVAGFNGIGSFSLISTLFRGNLINPDKIKKLFKKEFGDTLQENTDIKFVAIATNIRTGGETRLTTGLLRENVMASISIPAMFPKVKIGNSYYIDGGLSNNLPEDVARELLPDAVVVSVDVLGEYSKQVEKLRFKTLENVINASTIMTQRIINLKPNNFADLRIVISQPRVSQMDFNKTGAEKSVRKGVIMANKNIDTIKKLLGCETNGKTNKKINNPSQVKG